MYSTHTTSSTTTKNMAVWFNQ